MAFLVTPSEDRSCRKLVITSLLVTAVAVLLSQNFHGMEMPGSEGSGGEMAEVKLHRTSNFRHANNFQFHFSFFLLEGSRTLLLPFLKLVQTMLLLCHKLAASPGQEWGGCFPG